MADNVWDNSDGDNDGNVAANWSLGTVPSGTDVMTFDSATTSDNCSFSGNISCQGMKFANTYTGTIDAVTHDITLGTDGLAATNGGSATILMGTGSTWTSSGDFTTTGIGTVTRETSAIIMTGDGTTLSIAGDSVINVQVSADISLTAGNIYGTFVIDSGKTCTLIGSPIFRNGSMTINGTLNGSGTAYCREAVTVSGTGAVNSAVKFRFQGGGSLSNSGTWSPTTYVQQDFTLNAGTYGGEWTCTQTDINNDEIFTFGGNVTFTGQVSWDSDKTSRTYTIDNGGNYDVTFQGNLVLAESLGTLVRTAGTGTMTFSDTADQVVTIPSGWTDELEDIVVDKTAGSVKLVGDDLYCQSLDVQDGDFDLNGLTLDSAGSVTLAAGARFYNVDTASTAMDAGSTINIASGTLTLQGSA